MIRNGVRNRRIAKFRFGWIGWNLDPDFKPLENFGMEDRNPRASKARTKGIRMTPQR